MGIFRATFFIVGTSIGAGFISGAELVRFFRGEQFLFPVLLSSLVFMLLVFLFLRIGKRYGGYKGAVRFLFRKAAPAIEVAVCLLSLIPAAGMLAGLDALLPDVSPLLSMAGIAVSALCIWRGTKGISLLNAVLVPALLLFVWACGWRNFSFRYPTENSVIFPYLGGIVYAGMNASVRSVRRGERGVYSRKNLRRRGGRACLRNAVSLRYAECEDIFYRRCACDSDFARVRALSLADRVRRSEKKTYKIRRKRRRAPCGVSDVPHGTFGHCQLFLSDPRRSRTDIFSCLYS